MIEAEDVLIVERFRVKERVAKRGSLDPALQAALVMD